MNEMSQNPDYANVFRSLWGRIMDHQDLNPMSREDLEQFVEGALAAGIKEDQIYALAANIPVTKEPGGHNSQTEVPEWMVYQARIHEIKLGIDDD